MLIHDTATPAPASEVKAPKDIYEGFINAAAEAIATAAANGRGVTGAMYMRHRTAYELQTAYEQALDESRRLVELATKLVASLERYGTAHGGNNYEGQAARVAETLTALRLRAETYRMADACAEREAAG